MNKAKDTKHKKDKSKDEHGEKAKRMPATTKAQKARTFRDADRYATGSVAPTPGSAEGDRDTVEEDLRIQAARGDTDKVND